jgi:hypothetical protein
MIRSASWGAVACSAACRLKEARKKGGASRGEGGVGLSLPRGRYRPAYGSSATVSACLVTHFPQSGRHRRTLSTHPSTVSNATCWRGKTARPPQLGCVQRVRQGAAERVEMIPPARPCPLSRTRPATSPTRCPGQAWAGLWSGRVQAVKGGQASPPELAAGPRVGLTVRLMVSRGKRTWDCRGSVAGCSWPPSAGIAAGSKSPGVDRRRAGAYNAR